MLLHQVGAEIPIDSEDADEANLNDNGRTLLYVFSRGCIMLLAQSQTHSFEDRRKFHSSSYTV